MTLTAEIFLVVISLIVIIAYVGTIVSQKEKLKGKDVHVYPQNQGSWNEPTKLDIRILHKKINSAWEQSVKATGKEPLYAYCRIRYKTDTNGMDVYIKMNNTLNGKDDRIMFYCSGLSDFLGLLDGKEKFLLEKFYYFTDVL